jgi:hypothetical protein
VIPGQMKTLLKKLSFKHKNNKVLYYTIGFSRQLFPGKIFRERLNKKIAAIKDYDNEYLRKRVNYYNKLNDHVSLSENIKKTKLIFSIPSNTQDILTPD